MRPLRLFLLALVSSLLLAAINSSARGDVPEDLVEEEEEESNGFLSSGGATVENQSQEDDEEGDDPDEETDGIEVRPFSKPVFSPAPSRPPPPPPPPARSPPEGLQPPSPSHPPASPPKTPDVPTGPPGSTSEPGHPATSPSGSGGPGGIEDTRVEEPDTRASSLSRSRSPPLALSPSHDPKLYPPLLPLSPRTYPRADVVPGNCLDVVNALRSLVQMQPYTAPEKGKEILGPKVDDTKLWEAVCKGEIKSILGKGPLKVDGVWGLAPQNEPQPNCGEAVEYWTNAVDNFQDTPGALDDVEDPHEWAQKAALYLLFNPDKNPTMECVTVSCLPDPNQIPEGTTGTKREIIYKLFCLGNPPVDSKNRVFTDDIWSEIRKVSGGKNGATAATPALLLVAAAAVGGLLI